LLLLSHKELSEIQVLIQASSDQMPLTVSAVLDLIPDTDLGMKGFISYYQFPRHLILTPTNSSSNLLLNLQHDNPQLLPMGTCCTAECSWKQLCCSRLCFPPLCLFSYYCWLIN